MQVRTTATPIEDLPQGQFVVVWEYHDRVWSDTYCLTDKHLERYCEHEDYQDFEETHISGEPWGREDTNHTILQRTYL